MQFLVSITLLVLIGVGFPAFSSKLPGNGQSLSQIFKRQLPIGLPCSGGYEFLCYAHLHKQVCCNGYCHYDCDTNKQPEPQPQWPTRAPPAPTTTRDPGMQPGVVVTGGIAIPSPTPTPCVVKCNNGVANLDAATDCVVTLRSTPVSPVRYNATHTVVRAQYKKCCPNIPVVA